MERQKLAVVTGGTKGIGLSITKKFLSEGYSVAAVYASDDKAAHELSDNSYQGRLSLIKIPVDGAAAAEKLARRIEDLTSRVNVLVCNSGTTDPTAFEKVAAEEWQRVMDVNLNGPMFLIQRLLPLMPNGEGSVVIIGSALGAAHPHARSVSYGVSKAMLEGLTRQLAEELLDRGITVNCIAPGFVDTTWHAGKTPEHRKRIEDKIALRRFARPEEITELCWQTVQNRGINGSVLAIDGGYCFE